MSDKSSCDESRVGVITVENNKQNGVSMYGIDVEMRGWLLECFTDAYDQEEINGLTHEQLVSAINTYYDGGMVEFVNCSAWVV